MQQSVSDDAKRCARQSGDAIADASAFCAIRRASKRANEACHLSITRSDQACQGQRFIYQPVSESGANKNENAPAR